ncbi:MGH1-like glycoside hydrolase domain-containing protein [Sinomicrobium weinanense]|uniref:Trehalase n=1 Tax=Sinomicrobium weinanense TaxID=2842200 RepID=A0A926JS51_9FLAO|nr:trehalase family glycosidase [Sinomicrobium weinanense]MBC9796257.1 trehalase [Sinomicrobium weinanense]MBU3122288.1 trehalase [Sinomicrobium weinanense]
MNKHIFYGTACMLSLFLACNRPQQDKPDKDRRLHTNLELTKNSINYTGEPRSKKDRDMLMYSDQGAWFAYGFTDTPATYGGFTGPFLMTQDNGEWLAKSLARVQLTNPENNTPLVRWEKDLDHRNAYHSHLEQVFENDTVRVSQELVFMSGHTALQRTKIVNVSKHKINVRASFAGSLFDTGIKISGADGFIKLTSEKSPAIGYVRLLQDRATVDRPDTLRYEMSAPDMTLAPGETKAVVLAQTFIFPEYSWKDERQKIKEADFEKILEKRKSEKETQLSALMSRIRPGFREDPYRQVLAKAVLTLQNNWRIPAGELKHEGLFPSYHYEWFHGFWSWDSWKHAVGLAAYDPRLAKDQIRAMFDFQREDGFIVDCIYRDTTIEAHNERDTKPPLAGWAVAKVIAATPDTAFAKEMYPKLKKYHYWWYKKRDHDQDGLCEYGSTDGTLIAAKWESGMDNAIRFDHSEILKNEDGAYSLDQESVDLNAYLYAEKQYLAELAAMLNKEADREMFKKEAQELKQRIREQFYSEEDGWFYDTSLDGKTFVKGAGSEGWIPLWAGVASEVQAEAVMLKMMDPAKFYTKVPFQTMSKDHPEFAPMDGYWRGPNWLDQSYFGIRGLRNHGYDKEADKATTQLIKGAEGLLERGVPIRENYHPLTGKGLYAKNFSWSAAHIIMMLTEEK